MKPTLPFAPGRSEAVLSPLSVPISLASIGSLWDVGINGRGFMLSTLDQESPFEFRSYEVQAIPVQKPRIDDAEEPGEQTLAGWWARAQHSWHGGAGQFVFDSPFSDRFKFSESFGVNPWNLGQMSLLKNTDLLQEYAAADVFLLSSPTALFYTRNGNLIRDPNPDASGETSEGTLATHNGTPINSVTTDGERVFAAFSGGSLGVKSCPIVGTLAWSDVSALLAPNLIQWVKGRLMGAKGPSLYEFDLNVTTAPEPFYTDTTDGFTFTAIAETGPAIYFAGGVGDRSEILCARLTAQDIPFASVATVGAPRNVWTAPEGETIHSIHGYLGTQLLIGTSLGVRIGTVTTGEGDLEVSPIITRTLHGNEVIGTSSPVLCFEPQLEFAWFGWSLFDDAYTGVGRLHLGSLAWASDLMWVSQGVVSDIAYYEGRIYFVVREGGNSTIVKEHATELVPEGWFVNREIRFATTERKQLRYFDILTSGTGQWSLQLSNDGGPFSNFESNNTASGYSERVVDLEASRFGVRILLHRDPEDINEGPVLQEWRLRSDPRASGRFRYFCTVMVYDFMVNMNEQEAGFIGQAMADLNFLTGLYRSDADFIFQGPETGVPNAPAPPSVKLEDVRFKTYTPSEKGSGFGGLCLLIMREVH